MTEDQLQETVMESWPDCKQAQCRQVHELLNALAEMLGVKFDPATYTVGKTIHIFEAIGKLQGKDLPPVLDPFGCHKQVARWLEQGTYRSVIHRHDETFVASDESERKFMTATTIPLLADALMNWPDGAEKIPPIKYVNVYAL